MRFQKIDDSTRGIHAFLTSSDTCLYLREYTSRQGYKFSETNNLISNLKKKRGDGGYHYKAPAIAQCGAEVASALNPDWLKIATIVPVPPSKARTDPAYDDRMTQVAGAIAATAGLPVDVREIVVQRASIRSAHEGADRPTVDELLEIYEIDADNATPAPKQIAILDDVLTAGTHFRAMCTILGARFPGVPITGLFIARRVFAADDRDELFPSDDI